MLAGRALAREAAPLYFTSEDRRIAPSVAKLYRTQKASKTAVLAVQVRGTRRGEVGDLVFAPGPAGVRASANVAAPRSAAHGSGRRTP
jgi:hypothetical protein